MSRKDDLINSYGGVNGILSQTPDVKARIRNELLEASRQDAIDANTAADKAAKGSLTNDLAGIAGQVGGVVGGAYLGNQIFGVGASQVAQQTGGQIANQVGGQVANQGITQVGQQAGTQVASQAGSQAAAQAGAQGAQQAGSMLAGNGTLATYGVPAAVAAGTYYTGKQILDQLQGKPQDTSPSGQYGRAQLAYSTMGASELLKPLGINIGHSKNYWTSQDRKKMANAINDRVGSNVLDPKIFEDDPGSWSYDLKSPGVNKELGAAQALTAILTGEKSGSKMWGDLSSRFANDVKSGTTVKDLYSKYGLDYNKAMEAVGASNYDTKLKAELQNGLNDAFGQQPRQQSNQGSPGRRPQQSNSNSGVKKKAKDASLALSQLWK